MLSSVILPPGVAAFRAPEEPDLALVGRTELAEPPESEVVLALGATDGDCRESRDLAFLLDNYDLPLRPPR